LIKTPLDIRDSTYTFINSFIIKGGFWDAYNIFSCFTTVFDFIVAITFAIELVVSKVTAICFNNIDLVRTNKLISELDLKSDFLFSSTVLLKT
tara:strand:+ start:305 stop:583 length:279 start_codon:yes stop_codon:yes gene_type:complete